MSQNVYCATYSIQNKEGEIITPFYCKLSTFSHPRCVSLTIGQIFFQMPSGQNKYRVRRHILFLSSNCIRLDVE